MNATTFAPEDLDENGIARADAVPLEQIAQQGATATAAALPPADQPFAQNVLERAITSGAGALDGLTAGLGGAGIAKIADTFDPSGQDSAEFRRQLGLAKEKHGTAYGIGQAAGMLAPALATGGASTAVEGAEGAAQGARGLAGLGSLTPAGAIGRLGAAVEGRFAGGAGMKLLGAAARGATEGAIYGGTEAAGDGLLNHDLTAEKVITGVGLGAVVGGAAGGVLHGAFEAGGAAVRGLRGLGTRGATEAATEGVASAAAGSDAKSIGARLYDKGVALTSKVSGLDADEATQIFRRDAEGAHIRSLANPEAGERLVNDTTDALTKHINALKANSDSVSEEARGALKEGHVAQRILRGNEAETHAALAQKADGLINSIDDIVNGREGRGVAPQHVKSLESLTALGYEAKAALSAGDNAKAYVAFDTLKRAEQKVAKSMTNGISKIIDPLEYLQAQEGADFVRKQAEHTRELLENERLFGEQAVAQKHTNAAWTKVLDTGERFKQSFLTEGGRNAENPFRRDLVADPERVDRTVRGITNKNKNLILDNAYEHLEAHRQLADAIAEHTDLPAEKLLSVRQVSDSATAAKKLLDKTKQDLGWANRFKEIAAKESKGTHFGLAGAVLGHVPGAVLGGVLDAAGNPTRLAQQMDALTRVSAKTDNFATKAVRSFFAGGEGKAATKIGTKVAAVDEIAAGGKRFADAVEATSKLPAQIETMASRLGDLPPAFAVALANKTSVSAQFLASKVPAALREPDPYLPHRDWSGVPPYERTKFLRYYNAVNDPMGTLKDVSRGTVSYEGAEALRTCAPLLYAQVQQQVQNTAAERAAKGDLDTGAVRRMGVLFGVAALPTQKPDVFAALQANVAQPPPPGQTPSSPGAAPRRPIKLPSQQSDYDRLEGK